MRCSSKRGSILLSLLACLVNAPAALAQYGGGQWTGPYFSSVGSTQASVSTTTTAYSNTTFSNSPWTLSPSLTIPSYLPGYNYFSLNADQAFSTIGSGTYTVTYIYKNYYTQQQMTPPLLQSKVYLKEVSGVTWSAAGYNNGLLITGAGNADNGRKDPLVAYADQTGGISGGTHLLQQDGSSGLVQFNVSPSASSGLCLFGMLGAHGQAGTVFNYQWQFDTRSVTIVCAPLEDGGNFHKGANDLPVANVRNSDGSMTVDTTPTSLDTVAKEWYFSRFLGAQTTGFDVDTRDKWFDLVNTQFDWMPGGYTSFQTSTQAITNGTFAQLPTTYSAHVKATDLRPNLSATAENDYTIHIHSPFENVIETAPRVFDHNDRYPWTFPSVIGGSSVTVQMVAEMPRTWSVMGQSGYNVIGSTLAGVCGSGLIIFFAPEATVGAAVADMIFNVVGWTVMNSGTPEPTTTKGVVGSYGTFLQAIEDQKIINVDGAFPNINDIIAFPGDERIKGPNSFDAVAANPQRYWNLCAPMGRCHSGARYIRYTLLGDVYGANGYIGRQTYYPVKQNNYVEDVWEWTFIIYNGIN